MKRIPVTILGATGVVGQRFVRRLANHPWFEIRHLAASSRSVGRAYAEACDWRIQGEAFGGLGDRVLEACDPALCGETVVFSALDAGPALEIEAAFARAGSMVFSNASAWRMEDDVPLLVPEVNPGHLALLERQRRERGWSGAILCNPNCTTTVMVMALAPLQEAFGIEAVLLTSMQAVSGAGYPGVPSLDILGNVVPFIRGEEGKVEEETPKLLGRCVDGRVVDADLKVSAMCHRVPVIDGHMEAVSVRLRGNPGLEEVRKAMELWRPEPQRLALPSAPPLAIRLALGEDRPQPRRDVEVDEGMSVHVGRIRACAILGTKFAILGHNTERGAAGGSILNAELALAQGVFS
jgi:aspartate-semialdehyde dehydrogenase